MYLVYAVYNQKHNKIYIGQTENIEERMKLHNNHTFVHSYTSRFDGTWQLIYQEEVATRTKTLIREKQLKSYQGRQFIKQHIPR
jgi:putative endonuclease